MKRNILITTAILLSSVILVQPVLATDNTSTSSGTTHLITNPTTPRTGDSSGSGNSQNTPSTSAQSFFNLNDITALLKEASGSATKSTQALQNIIKGADMMISNRLTTLNALNTRIQSDTRLSSDEKTSLTNDVQTAITGLNNLKVTIDADTDPGKARTDAKMIVTEFRVYEELEPKLRLLITLNNLQTTSNNIQALIPQVQSVITTLGAGGKDVSGLTTLLTDVSSQLTTINTTITADITTLNGLTLSTTDLKTPFTKVETDINTIVKTDFGKIHTDFGQMRDLFHKIITGQTPGPSPIATGSATPIATP